MLRKFIFYFAFLFSTRETVFRNRTDEPVIIKVYGKDPKSKKLLLRDDMSFELQKQSSVRKKATAFCFEGVNPDREGILIAYWNGKQAKIDGCSLKTAAAFVFDKGEDGRVVVQPIKECSTDISRFRMCACIGRRSYDERKLTLIPFKENETESTNIAYSESKAESEAGETESSISYPVTEVEGEQGSAAPSCRHSSFSVAPLCRLER